MSGKIEPRRVYYVNESMLTSDGFVPSIITEGRPGHHRCDFSWGKDYLAARAIADKTNADLGYTPADVLAIVASSMGSTRWCNAHNSALCDCAEVTR